ncbi:GNAT family N-acetyltransferase [Phyllobacterium meliloti]|uniref:GNAT family N-acetyltransferase n=1 Tax=Phyllobacterium meliloti TaxID=555317 RepID=UPI001D152619|nr:GNAT family N-acetyltransferase [Phyllobacterium sp. T1293]UGX86278.1 GNAT family N-acetyltransferase [Phyllobacterium sp. T1293]
MRSMQLAQIRQIEAVGFRAWPASSVHYDGSWAIRLTANHPSKRLNSVNPLDPGDTDNMEERVAHAIQRFKAHGRPPVFRLSPLAPKELDAYLEGLGWPRFDESFIMVADLEKIDFSDAIDQLPLQDIDRFIDAAIEVHQDDPALKPGLFEVINAIVPARGLFVIEEGSEPVSTAICVQDGALAGLFNIGTLADRRRKGHGRMIVKTAIKWAVQHGAKRGWLQVEADNAGAIALYEKLGFAEAYRYAYRRAPDA